MSAAESVAPGIELAGIDTASCCYVHGGTRTNLITTSFAPRTRWLGGQPKRN